MDKSTFKTKVGLAEMLKGGVIMDVVNPEQARIAEEAGAVAVMALERVPADIRVEGGVARMSDPQRIREIQEAVTIPVIISGSDMRATPPAFRMSAGTRSSAITATAPASSAILACSPVTTSMMTPPFNISARPRLTG